MNNSKNNLVPKLRFPEFIKESDWVEDTLVNLADFRRGSFPQPYGLPKWYDEINGMPFIQVYDVGEDFKLKPQTKNKISKLAAEQSVFIPKGTVIITIQGSIGRVAITQYDAYIDRTLLLFEEFHQEIDKTFFAYVLYLLFEIEKQKAPGGIIKTITKEVLSQFTVKLPKPKEQQKIAACLSSLDEVITAEVQKLDILKEHKKGLLQNLLPQEGEIVPKYRFEEFEDSEEWELKALGELVDVLMCKRIFAEETNENSGVPFFKIGTLGGKPDAFISRELFEEYKLKYNYPRKGEVLITCSGTVGKCLIYDGQDAYYQDSNIVWLDNEKLQVSNELLFHLLSNVNWSILNSTTITRIYGSDLRGLKIQYPKVKEEQDMVARCLSSCDQIIIEQSKKVEELKCHKKGLLQGLFP